MKFYPYERNHAEDGWEHKSFMGSFTMGGLTEVLAILKGGWCKIFPSFKRGVRKVLPWLGQSESVFP